MSDQNVPGPLLRFRRFRDPEDVHYEIPRTEFKERLRAGDLDLEDEWLEPRSRKWIQLWKVEDLRNRVPKEWRPLMSQREPELRELKARVRRGELAYSDYIERREQQLRQVVEGAAPTLVPSIARKESSAASTAVQVDFPASITERYKFVRQLGEGGTASVSLWRKEDSGAEVAVKITHPQFNELVKAELKHLELISSPYVVRVRDCGAFDDNSGRWWIVFDYIPGRTLRQYMSKNAGAPISPAALWRLLEGLARGLASLHAKNVVHRDLTPNNVILRATEDPHELIPVLIDLGMARSGAASGQTIIGGTPGYQSPEQEQGKSCTPASDVYCFGRLAYELTTGKRFAGARLIDINQACPGMPAGLDKLIKDRCLDADPHRRFKDARQLVEALERLKEAGQRSKGVAPLVQQPAPAPSSIPGRRLGFFQGDMRRTRTRAEAGDPAAMRDLGLALLHGNAREAADWLGRAAKGGDARAQFELGRLKATVKGVDQEWEESLQLFRSAANAGNADAKFELFQIYRRGLLGVERSEASATEWVNDAASAGHPRAMWHLAKALERGVHRPKDLAQAVSWFREGSERGDLRCMVSLGWRLWWGAGCIRDKTEARQWFLRCVPRLGWRFIVTVLTTGLGLTLLLAAAVLWAWWFFGWAPFGYAFPSDWLARQLPAGIVMRDHEPASGKAEPDHRGTIVSDATDSKERVDFSIAREIPEGADGIDNVNSVSPLQLNLNNIGTFVAYEGKKANYLKQGDQEFPRGGFSTAAKSAVVRGFHHPDGTAIIRLNVTRGKAVVDLHELKEQFSEKPLVLVDANGRIFPPIGYFWQREDKVRVRLDATQPITRLEDLPSVSSSGDQTLHLIFAPTLNAVIKGVSVGDSPVGSCNYTVVEGWVF